MWLPSSFHSENYKYTKVLKLAHLIQVQFYCLEVHNVEKAY